MESIIQTKNNDYVLVPSSLVVVVLLLRLARLAQDSTNQKSHFDMFIPIFTNWHDSYN